VQTNSARFGSLGALGSASNGAPLFVCAILVGCVLHQNAIQKRSTSKQRNNNALEIFPLFAPKHTLTHNNTFTSIRAAAVFISMCIIPFLSVSACREIESECCAAAFCTTFSLHNGAIYCFCIRSRVLWELGRAATICEPVFMSASSKSSFLQKGSAHLMADADANCLKYANENTQPVLWLTRRRPTPKQRLTTTTIVCELYILFPRLVSFQLTSCAEEIEPTIWHYLLHD
jgi:hypothetical protein